MYGVSKLSSKFHNPISGQSSVHTYTSALIYGRPATVESYAKCDNAAF